jgi:hypothetical protein
MVRSFAMACVVSSLAIACGSGDGTGPDDASGDADAQTVDAAIDSQGFDVHAPAAPACKTGDREEWSGTIPNTVVAVAVCSTCGASYVVVANGNASSEDVTLDNKTKTLATTTPAGGTATSATLADNPSDGTISVCRTTGGAHDCIPVSPSNQIYCDPFRSVKDLVPERIDQGVDYACSGPIYAMGPGTIDVFRNRNDTGWPGGTFMSYKLTAGPAAGKTIYLAENIDLDTSLKSGSFVFSGTVLGTQVNASPESEIGWGVPGAGYTAEYSCYTEGCDTALGDNFNELLVALKTVSGVPGPKGCCTSAAGYPTNWATLIAAWQ